MKKKSISILLSIIIPGLGHIYIHKAKKGFALIVLFIFLFLMSNKINFLSIPALLIYIYSIISSYKETNIYNSALLKN
jgi:hypothetical protein